MKRGHSSAVGVKLTSGAGPHQEHLDPRWHSRARDPQKGRHPQRRQVRLRPHNSPRHRRGRHRRDRLPDQAARGRLQGLHQRRHRRA